MDGSWKTTCTLRHELLTENTLASSHTPSLRLIQGVLLDPPHGM